MELIEGELVEMTAIGTRHFSCVNRLNRLLVMNVGDEAIVSVQNPVRLNEYNEPQPDVTVIRPRDYRESLPMPEDVMLLIEVSDTTLAYDRGVKLPLYARKELRPIRRDAADVDAHATRRDSLSYRAGGAPAAD